MPAPHRKRTTTWKEFIRSHQTVLAGTDFFTVEVFTRRGLVTFYVLFFSAMPSVLVELGFLTNRQEQARLASAAGQRSLAEAIGAAVIAFGANDLDAWQEFAPQDE